MEAGGLFIASGTGSRTPRRRRCLGRKSSRDEEDVGTGSRTPRRRRCLGRKSSRDEEDVPPQMPKAKLRKRGRIGEATVRAMAASGITCGSPAKHRTCPLHLCGIMRVADII
jgi:hypothetical protein